MSIQTEKLNPSSATYFGDQRTKFDKFLFLKLVRKMLSRGEDQPTIAISNHTRKDVGLPKADGQYYNFALYGKDLPDVEIRRRW